MATSPRKTIIDQGQPSSAMNGSFGYSFIQWNIIKYTYLGILTKFIHYFMGFTKICVLLGIVCFEMSVFNVSVIGFLYHRIIIVVVPLKAPILLCWISLINFTQLYIFYDYNEKYWMSRSVAINLIQAYCLYIGEKIRIVAKSNHYVTINASLRNFLLILNLTKVPTTKLNHFMLCFN